MQAEGPSELVVRYRDGATRRSAENVLNTRRLRLARTELLTCRSPFERDRLIARLREDPAVEWAEPDYRFSTCDTPNDPQYANQWPLQKIQAPAAWKLTSGQGITVAVLDTGVDFKHPDLAGQVLAGPDMIDRDQNPQDLHGHGTHVAGTIAALRNNGLDIVGVAPAARILAVRVLDAQGQGSMSAIADGVLAAVQAGAQVINMSLGGASDGLTLRRAIEQAQQAGVLVVAAAGNEGSTRLSYPAAYPGVLSVGATNAQDQRTSFSNHGTWVNIAAPGDRILSSRLGGGTKAMSGTSMAAPHVAAAAAMLKAAQPTWNAEQIRRTLQETGDPVSGFSSNPALRRLHVLRALQGAPNQNPSPTPEQPTPSPTLPTPMPSPTPWLPWPTPPSPSPLPTPSTAPALSISQVAAVAGRYNARISWQTNIPADAQVYYGRTTLLGSVSPLRSTLSTQHTMTLDGLRRLSIHYYRVRSRDAQGRVVFGPLRSFRTTR
jgi:thermitase